MRSRRNDGPSRAAWVALALICPALAAGTLHGRTPGPAPVRETVGTLHERGAAAGPGEPATPLPPGTRVVRDVPYGSDPAQRFDVYAPDDAKGAPVIFMVHGGAWSAGDKASRGVVTNKVARWVPRGFVVVSTNYRMLPKATPVDQARDVARALAAAQDSAAAWGGDRSKFILMGHSAGAHLVALLTASPSMASELGVTHQWLGTLLLDGAALDVVQIMERRHARLYDRAFGRAPAEWRAASPYHVMTSARPPILAVCSTRRPDACRQARRFTAKAASLGTRTSVLPRDLSHAEIDRRLGEPGDYTAAVESFLRTLDGAVARALGGRL